MKVKKVHQKRIAINLQKQNCKLIRIEQDIRNPDYNVYVFEIDEQFSRAFDRAVRDYEKYKGL